jgi:hypothetical protein
MAEELRDAGAAPDAAPVRPRFPWLVPGLVGTLVSAIVLGIFIVRQAPSVPQPPARAPGSAPATPNVPQAPGVPATEADKPGTLGIVRTQCQGFADIAARFWDLKNEGRTLEFAFDVIARNSAGDEQKQRVLKALAQVVYKDPGLTRDSAYRNAFEACLKQ